jgi:KipI family sensor histidine kinase inhibitor
MSSPPVRVDPLGERAVLLTFGERIAPGVHARITALARQLRHAPPAGVEEVVPAYTTLAAWFDPARRRYDELAAEILATEVEGPTAGEDLGREWVIPVRYDGPDLEWVAAQTGLPPDEVVHRHTARRYTVYLLGFVPGFAYLGELDPALVLPRRSTPRQRVPAGSVAIAGAQTAVYPLETPGGWHLIGSTALRLFDSSREPPALLAAGDTVRFEPV